jgi:hypothetical protein
MENFEKLGVFYLGRPFDLAKKKLRDGIVLYDSRDLVTHAVCVGMTGSGKTCLCVALIEEAALDGVPAILIDPKGDLGNLLLTFPDLKPADFRPWINEEDAARKGVSADDYAREQAALWKAGLAEWGEDGARIAKLKASADFTIFTPGSSAGRPVSILRSFAAPNAETRSDAELLGERVATTATGLLALLRLDVDPIQSREHILISTIFEAAWKAGEDLELSTLIERIQKPPVARVGVLDLESFFPAKERFALAMKFNNLLAAPGFSAWLEGEALDIGAILRTPEGKPRVSIFSIAHLSDAERMFFVTMLLNETVGWMRGQSGTTSLRALLYMDEIAGYFPPVATPPSKAPMLTLLKQGRAFGLGVVLTTQNPVDLDYKGLSNAGTWLLGRLQTERDKARVLDGLEGVAAGGGPKFERAAMEQTLAGLQSRVFLMNDVHEDAPVVFQSRWAMSYLRGPLTRGQIKTLIDPQKRQAGARGAPAAKEGAPAKKTARAVPWTRAPPEDGRCFPAIAQYFLPVAARPVPRASSTGRWPSAPRRCTTRRRTRGGLDEDVLALVALTDSPEPVRGKKRRPRRSSPISTRAGPVRSEVARPPPAEELGGWAATSGWLFRTRRSICSRARRRARSRPGEASGTSARASGRRRGKAGCRGGDAARRYAARLEALAERKRRAEQAVAREKEETTSQGIQTAISIGATVLGALLGRKAVSATNIGRATTAARGAGRTMKQAGDVGRAKENVAAIDQQIADLEAELKAELDQRAAATDPVTEKLETIALRPKKSDISVRLVALAWAPFGGDAGDPAPLWK